MIWLSLLQDFAEPTLNDDEYIQGQKWDLKKQHVSFDLSMLTAATLPQMEYESVQDHIGCWLRSDWNNSDLVYGKLLSDSLGDRKIWYISSPILANLSMQMWLNEKFSLNISILMRPLLF